LVDLLKLTSPWMTYVLNDQTVSSYVRLLQ